MEEIKKDFISLPLVSIIIPVYNAEKYLKETIENALRQTWLRKEIIIVDDGSTDGSLAIAKQFEGDSVLVFGVSNGGAAKARNIGFEHSRGEYIQYLDADDLLGPDKIERQMNRLLLEKNPENTLASGQWIRFSTTIDEVIGGVGPGGKAENDFIPLEWLLLRPYNLMTVHAWLTHRKLIERAGPWNEKMTLDDDGEFFIRVVNASAKILFCSGALAYYRTLTGGNSLSTVSGFIKTESNCTKLKSSYLSLEAYKNALSKYSDLRVNRKLGENFLQMAFTSYGVCNDVYDKCIAQPEIPVVQRFIVYNWIGGKYGLLTLLLGWRSVKKLMIQRYRLL